MPKTNILRREENTIAEYLNYKFLCEVTRRFSEELKHSTQHSEEGKFNIMGTNRLPG